MTGPTPTPPLSLHHIRPLGGVGVDPWEGGGGGRICPWQDVPMQSLRVIFRSPEGGGATWTRGSGEGRPTLFSSVGGGVLNPMRCGGNGAPAVAVGSPGSMCALGSEIQLGFSHPPLSGRGCARGGPTWTRRWRRRSSTSTAPPAPQGRATCGGQPTPPLSLSLSCLGATGSPMGLGGGSFVGKLHEDRGAPPNPPSRAATSKPRQLILPEGVQPPATQNGG